MAKIIVGNVIKKRMLIDGYRFGEQAGGRVPLTPSIKNQLTHAAYFKFFRTPNDSVPENLLNSECVGGKNNTIELEWKETSNGIELVNPLIYTVLPNENARTLLIGTKTSNDGIDGATSFDVVVSPKPSSWAQYIRNITISVKGDGEA